MTVVVPATVLVTVVVEVIVLPPLQPAGALVKVGLEEGVEVEVQSTQIGSISTVAGCAGIGMVTVSWKTSDVASYAVVVSVLNAVIVAGQLVALGVLVVVEELDAQVDQPS